LLAFKTWRMNRSIEKNSEWTQKDIVAGPSQK